MSVVTINSAFPNPKTSYKPLKYSELLELSLHFASVLSIFSFGNFKIDASFNIRFKSLFINGSAPPNFAIYEMNEMNDWMSESFNSIFQSFK